MANENNETTDLMVFSDRDGNRYNLAVIPDKGTPKIKEASTEILQEMQVQSIIQNLENVGKLMFIAYNALSGTTVQSLMSGLQKRYLDLMDDSSQAIIGFKNSTQEICKNVAEAYKWLIQGKEKMALIQFDKCATAASDMADKAEQLAGGFRKLSDDAENVLEKTQDESALQYKRIDEVKQKMQEYDAQLKKCESLQESLNKDIDSINQAYQEARRKENTLFDMKKGLMITQIVTSCIGAIIPTVSSVKSKQESGGNQQAAAEAQNSLSQKEKEKEGLSTEQEEKEKEVSELEQKKSELEKEIEDIKQKIKLEEEITAREADEKEANLKKYKAELEQKESELADVEKQLESSKNELINVQNKLDTVSSAINTLNKQLSDYAESCQSDLERAEKATQDALDKKLDLEKQRRETLASIQEFTGLIKMGVEQKNVAETAVQTLGVAIRCIKQVVVALATAAKFWRSMEEYCKTLSSQGMGKMIEELSEGLTLDERMEYYQEQSFKDAFLTYICRWAALYYVCDDYRNRSEAVRGMVADNIQSSGDRETEWKMAGELANQMGVSIQQQVEDSEQISSFLEGGK